MLFQLETHWLSTYLDDLYSLIDLDGETFAEVNETTAIHVELRGRLHGRQRRGKISHRGRSSL